MKGLRLSPEQWKVLASAFSNMGQAAILFSAAAFFVPEALGLEKNFAKSTALLFLIGGLLVLAIGVIMAKKGK